MKETTECMLDKIPTVYNTDLYISNTWANGKVGAITDRMNNCVYRFYKSEMNKLGHYEVSQNNTPENCPIVATGIIGYWLHHRPNDYRFATWDIKQDKPFDDIFHDYTEIKLNNFKDYLKKSDPSSRRRDLDREFYTEVIIPIEEELNQQSKALYDYITSEERNLVGRIMDEYMFYLKEKMEEYGTEKLSDNASAELKVLKYWETNNDSVLGDMPDYEFNVICDDLERGGYLLVAWVEGHVPEGARLLDRGKLYLRQLEAEAKKKTTATTNGNSKQRPPHKKDEKKVKPDWTKYSFILNVEDRKIDMLYRLLSEKDEKGKQLIDPDMISHNDIKQIVGEDKEEYIKSIKHTNKDKIDAKDIIESLNIMLFKQVFLGQETDVRIIWRGDTNELLYLIDKMNKYKAKKEEGFELLLDRKKPGPKLWQLTRLRFMNGKERKVMDERTGKETTTKEPIEFDDDAFAAKNYPKDTIRLNDIIEKIAPERYMDIEEEIQNDFLRHSGYRKTNTKSVGELYKDGKFHDTRKKKNE
jgi:hypothetical protein